ncbi:NAD(P)H-dependent oxidoreductase [Sphingosinicella sp. LHD-64]|uniref:FMN-dependent NADH-azoreductase n=1 Tax=Sphingosinicella sp. LHD-64 TaxID=3072139 RepID=UPI00280F9666|nr:NAD(P)H-dependent oxidoreductase [Sphingosinicella sp. LHD-64]MDQ8756775.1 NAD(P)H-dependent oxidoreductase [Sphingosinicella sp. LHD-64]
MPRLLFIEASPRGGRSSSTAVAARLIERLVATQPELEVDHLALWDEALPEFDGATLAAKYARLAGQPHDAAQAEAWAVIERMVARLAVADHVVIATPMWNFSIPYRLKHYIDLVTQPGLSFTFDPATGYSPLLAPRPLHIVLSSAGDYRFGPSRGRPDLATPYLAAALDFIGLSDPVFVPVGPTIGAPDEVAEGHARALRQVDLVGGEG